MSRDSVPTEDNIIGQPRYPYRESEPQDLGSINNGTIGTGAKKTMEKKENFVNKGSVNKEKVAIYSSKNLSWSGVGKLIKGYNILDKDTADKWLEKNAVRLATPEEIKKEYDL